MDAPDPQVTSSQDSKTLLAGLQGPPVVGRHISSTVLELRIQREEDLPSWLAGTIHQYARLCLQEEIVYNTAYLDDLTNTQTQGNMVMPLFKVK